MNAKFRHFSNTMLILHEWCAVVFNCPHDRVPTDAELFCNFLNPANSGRELRNGLEVFLNYYNKERPHSSLGDFTPDEAYYRSRLQQRAA